MVSFIPAMPHYSELGIDRVMNGHLSDFFYPGAGAKSPKCKRKSDRTLSFSIDSILGLKSDSHFRVSRARHSHDACASELSVDHNVREHVFIPTERDRVKPQRSVPRTTESWAEPHHPKLERHRSTSVVCRCVFEAGDYTHKPWQVQPKHASHEPEHHSDSRTGEGHISCYIPSWQCLPCPFSVGARGDECRCAVGSYRDSGVRSCEEAPGFPCANSGCYSVKRSGACTPTEASDERVETSLRTTNRCSESPTVATRQSDVVEASDCACPVACRPSDFISLTDRDVCPTGNLTMQYIEEKHKGRRIGHPYQSRAPPKRKPVRHSFTTSQVAQLEKLFEKSKYLSSADRQRVATQLKMTDSQLKTWYQNRRTKMKREIAEMQEQQQRVYEKMTSAVASS